MSCEHTLNTLRYADRVKELKRPTTSNGEAGLSNADILAKQLMLPRQTSISHKIFINLNRKYYQDPFKQPKLYFSNSKSTK
jgi:hypothetical protein